MKSILYAGATLMIGASIYGFVDYKQTHNKKEFKELYKETIASDDVATQQNDLKTAKLTDVAEKKTSTADIAVIEKKTDASTTKATTKKVRKKKKIDARFFSRAPLKYDEQDIVPLDRIPEIKPENKEQ